MRFTGSKEIIRFWSLLKNESERGAAIVVAAFLDEKLGQLLKQKTDRSFASRISDALQARILTMNEHDDLHVIRDIRNKFAHCLNATNFDSAKSRQVNSLKTWTIVATARPKYELYFPTARDRFLYVAGTFFVRLKYRSLPTMQPLPEPKLWEGNAWLTVSSV